MLRRFGAWFSSAAGVWQTLGLVGLVVMLEQTHAIEDDHGFWLLYWLTVYSAVTQPILAWVTRQDSRQGDAILAEQRQILAEIRAVADRIEAKEDQEIAILAAAVVVVDEAPDPQADAPVRAAITPFSSRQEHGRDCRLPQLEEEGS